MSKILRVCAVVVLFSASSRAEIKLPAILSDHMVLQSGNQVPIWGMATPGARMRVVFGGQAVSGIADSNGYWSVRLQAMQPSAAGAEMTISETSPGQAPPTSVTIRDVLVGEVWLAAGQSNMAYPLDAMQGKEKALAAAENPQLHLFTVRHMTAAEPVGLHPGEMVGDLQGSWQVSDAKTAAAFSAVGYLVAAELQRSIRRPVGMISSNWGGTPIKTWMALTALKSQPALSQYVDEYQKALAIHQQQIANPQIDLSYKAADQLWHQEVGDKYDAEMRQWNQVNESGGNPGPRPQPSRPEPQNPDPTGVPLGGYRPQSPGISWNAMFSPLIPYAIKGVLWYQGEANVSGYKEYGLMLRTMVQDWRLHWNEPAMEFLCVQLPANGKNGGARNLAHLREQQASVLTLPYTGLAISYDVGDPGNVHPANKVDIAHRLALIARGQVYGEKLTFTGPMMESAVQDGKTMRVRFTSIGGQLVIGQAPWVAKDAQQLPADRLVGFEIAGESGVFRPAVAAIDGDSVVLSADGVDAPRFVRYAWDESPQANLYDSSGLPAAPFRTGPKD